MTEFDELVPTLTDWFVDKIKGLFGGSFSDLSSPTPTGTDSGIHVLTDENVVSEDTPRPSGSEISIPLTIDFEFGPTPPMTAEEKRAARNR